jgi:hypothetical protein
MRAENESRVDRGEKVANAQQFVVFCDGEAGRDVERVTGRPGDDLICKKKEKGNCVTVTKIARVDKGEKTESRGSK